MFDISNISFMGILLGLVFYYVAALGFIAALTYIQRRSLADALYVRIANNLADLVFSVLMGMIAECLSDERTIVNALICGVVRLGLDICFFKTDRDESKWWQISIIIRVVPLSCLGGWITNYGY